MPKQHRALTRILGRIAEEGFWSVLSQLSPKEAVMLARAASDSYYNSGEDILTDSQYDALVLVLEESSLGREYVRQIGAPVRGEKVPLPYHMGSMNKIKEEGALVKWLEGHPGPYYLSDKIDGVSLLIVGNKRGIKVYTRGGGDVGQDVSHLLPYLSLPPVSKKKWAVRGEAIIPKEAFGRWEVERKNPRSMTAGLINTDPARLDEEMAYDIHFVAFEVVYPRLTPGQGYRWLEDGGWETVYHKKYRTLSAKKLSQIYATRLEESPYDIDGLVVIQDQMQTYAESGNPSYAFAFKGITEVKETTVRKVVWNPSKDGNLVPTLHLQPVTLSRSTVSKVTGIHARNVVDNGLGKGAVIQLIKSGEIIPRVISVLHPVEPELPPHSHWDSNGVHLVLDNPDTDARVQITRLTKFMVDIGVDGLSRGIVSRLYGAGYDTVEKILSLTPEVLVDVEGFAKTSAQKTVRSISKALEGLDLLTLMVASNLLGRSMSYTRLQTVLDAYPQIVKEYRKSSRSKWESKIEALPGFGSKNTEIFLAGLEEFIPFYREFTRHHTVQPYQGLEEQGDLFQSQVVVFSGFRNGEWEKYIKSQGGKMGGNVSKNTTLLVWSEGTGLKWEAAEKLGIPKMSKIDFQKKYGL